MKQPRIDSASSKSLSSLAFFFFINKAYWTAEDAIAAMQWLYRINDAVVNVGQPYRYEAEERVRQKETRWHRGPPSRDGMTHRHSQYRIESVGLW